MPWHPQTWRWHWWDYTCYHVLQSDTSASTFYNVIMPSTPTPPTFTLHLIFDSLFSLSIFSFFLVYFSSLFSIDFSHSGPDGQIDLKRSYVYPGCRLCASGICPIPCTHPLPKSLSRTSVKMAFLVARIGAQKALACTCFKNDPCMHPFSDSLKPSIWIRNFGLILIFYNRGWPWLLTPWGFRLHEERFRSIVYPLIILDNGTLWLL